MLKPAIRRFFPYNIWENQGLEYIIKEKTIINAKPPPPISQISNNYNVTDTGPILWYQEKEAPGLEGACSGIPKYPGVDQCKRRVFPAQINTTLVISLRYKHTIGYCKKNQQNIVNGSGQKMY